MELPSKRRLKLDKGSEGTHVAHASTVAVGERALLIFGPSGSGKSGLALQLMALGALLVADDRTVLSTRNEAVWAHAAEPIKGQIEARGIGILRVPTRAEARVALTLDMAQVESARMPPPRQIDVLGCDLPCLHKVEAGHFASALMHYLAVDE